MEAAASDGSTFAAEGRRRSRRWESSTTSEQSNACAASVAPGEMTSLGVHASLSSKEEQPEKRGNAEASSNSADFGGAQEECLEDFSTQLEKKDDSEKVPADAAPTGPVAQCSFMLLSVSIFAALTGLLMGYDMCVVAVVLDPVDRSFNLCGGSLTCSDKTLFVSILSPGAIVGSALGGVVADRIGRRPGLLLSDICLLVASICFAIGNSFALVLAGRFIVGVGVGLGFVVYSTYMCEIAPPSKRGILVACQEVAQCCGCMFAYVLAAVFTGEPWRTMMGAAGVVAAAQILGEVWVLPESPRFLVRSGKMEKARQSIRRLKIYKDPSDIDALKLRLCLKQLRQHRRPVLIAVGCAVAQNMTAANSVVYFALDIFSLAGVCNAYLAGAGVGAMKFAGVVVCLLLVDRVGRRRLLLLGSVGGCLCHLAMGTGFLLKEIHSIESHCGGPNAASAISAPSVILVVAMMLFMFFWNVSWAALMFVVASEVLPNSCRGLGMGLTITTFWTLAFIIQMSLENLFLAITTYGTFFVFACLTAATTLFVYFHVPEGAGVSLEHLQQEQQKQRQLRRERQQKAPSDRRFPDSTQNLQVPPEPPVAER